MKKQEEETTGTRKRDKNRDMGERNGKRHQFRIILNYPPLPWPFVGRKPPPQKKGKKKGGLTAMLEVKRRQRFNKEQVDGKEGENSTKVLKHHFRLRIVTD